MDISHGQCAGDLLPNGTLADLPILPRLPTFHLANFSSHGYDDGSSLPWPHDILLTPSSRPERRHQVRKLAVTNYSSDSMLPKTPPVSPAFSSSQRAPRRDNSDNRSARGMPTTFCRLRNTSRQVPPTRRSLGPSYVVDHPRMAVERRPHNVSLTVGTTMRSRNWSSDTFLSQSGGRVTRRAYCSRLPGWVVYWTWFIMRLGTGMLRRRPSLG